MLNRFFVFEKKYREWPFRCHLEVICYCQETESGSRGQVWALVAGIWPEELQLGILCKIAAFSIQFIAIARSYANESRQARMELLPTRPDTNVRKSPIKSLLTASKHSTGSPWRHRKAFFDLHSANFLHIRKQDASFYRSRAVAANTNHAEHPLRFEGGKKKRYNYITLPPHSQARDRWQLSGLFLEVFPRCLTGCENEKMLEQSPREELGGHSGVATSSTSHREEGVIALRTSREPTPPSSETVEWWHDSAGWDRKWRERFL